MSTARPSARNRRGGRGRSSRVFDAPPRSSRCTPPPDSGCGLPLVTPLGGWVGVWVGESDIGSPPGGVRAPTQRGRVAGCRPDPVDPPP